MVSLCRITPKTAAFDYRHLITINPQVLTIHNGDSPRRLGTAADVDQPHNQRGREPDPHARLQGHHAGTAYGVPRLLQPLRQEPNW